MIRHGGLMRINSHGGPGHPMAWVVWLVPAIFFSFELILRLIPSMIETDLETEFQLDEAQMGGILGMYYYAYAPMQLVVGILLDRYGARILLAGAAVLCAFGLVLMSMASTPVELGASRFIIGMGSSVAFIGAVYVAMVWFTPRRVALLTGLTAGVGFASGVLGDWFIPDLLGSPPQWRNTMLLLAMGGMGIAIAAFLIIPNRPAWYLDRVGIDHSSNIKDALGGLASVCTRPSVWLISVGCALIYLPMPLAANWGPRFSSETLGLSHSDGSHLWAWFYLGVTLGSPLAGWLSDRLGRRKILLLLGAIATTTLMFVLALWRTDETMTALLLCMLGLLLSTYVLGYPMAADLAPSHTNGSAIAFVNFSGMMLAGIFVWLFGVAVDAFAGNGVTPGPDDFRSAMLVTAGLISMSILLLALISSHNRTPAPRMT
jgi:sugar phosphate permease